MIYDRSNDGLAEGCCSAAKPCSHQKRDPYSICATCGGSATTERGDADTYTTEAIACGLSDVAGWLENEGGRDKHARTIRLGAERLRELGAASGGEGHVAFPSPERGRQIAADVARTIRDALTVPEGSERAHYTGLDIGLGDEMEEATDKAVDAVMAVLAEAFVGPAYFSAAPSHPGEADRVGLEELERLSAAAYQGPWTIEGDSSDGWIAGPVVEDDYGDVVVECPEYGCDKSRAKFPANAAFIVALVNAYRSGKLVPASLAALGTGEGSGGASEPTIADLEQELGVKGAAAVFRKALALAKEAAAEARSEVAHPQAPNTLSEVEEAVEAAAKLVEAFPEQILAFYSRGPNSPPGNGYRATTRQDLAFAIRGLATLRASQEQDGEVRS